jgi:hypothetical protein
MAWTGLVALALVALPAVPSLADDAEIRRKLEDLEKRQAAMAREQAEMNQEMNELKAMLGNGAPGARKAAVAGSPALPAAVTAPADASTNVAPAAAEATRVDEVERKQNVITEEVRKIKEALVVPETTELKSAYGQGPAASKVYSVTRGVSIGGYGEYNYEGVVSDRSGQSDKFDMARLVLYTGYKFSDRFLFNSEVEFEHGLTARDGDGEVHVEFANVDALLDPRINLRAGLMLMPVGFINEIHEPPFYHGNLRPPVEVQILPSTWSSGGVGVFGELAPALTYRTYAVVGLDASGFSADGISEGRQEGTENAKNWGWVGRVDYNPIAMLTIGGSAYVGDSGQGHSYGNSVSGLRKADVFTQVYETHAQLRTHGLELRLLGAWVDVGDALALSLDENINPGVVDPKSPSRPVAGRQFGWYGEAAYDVMPLLRPDSGQYLAPWLRYSRIDTQSQVPSGFTSDPLGDYDVFEVGLDYKPVPQLVFKVDYRNQDPHHGKLPDEVHVGAGFAY